MSHAFMHIYNSITIFCNKDYHAGAGRREAQSTAAFRNRGWPRRNARASRWSVSLIPSHGRSGRPAVLEFLHDSRWPSNLNLIRHRGCTETEMDWSSTGRGVTGSRGYVIELRLTAGDDAYPCAYRVAVTLGALKGQFQPVIANRTIIEPEFSGRGQGSNDNIQFAVVIEVADCRASMPPRRLRIKARILRQGRPPGSRLDYEKQCYFGRPYGVSAMAGDWTSPRLTKRSFQPSLSKSAIFALYPDIGSLSEAIPLFAVISVNPPSRLFW